MHAARARAGCANDRGTMVPGRGELEIADVVHESIQGKNPNAPEPGVLGGNRELHKNTFERGMLDLRLQLVRFRTDYLNQINTQSTFIAGCAVAMLSSGELVVLDDGADADWTSLHWWWMKVFNYMYTGSACVCLASSMWVIYTAANLITMSIHSTLYGDTTASIAEADHIIEARMKEVRLVFIVSLGAIMVAVLAMIGAVADIMILIFCFITFYLAGWHASCSDRGTVRLYERYTQLEIRDRWTTRSQSRYEVLIDLLTPYGYMTSTKRERFHDAADPVISALATQVFRGASTREAKAKGMQTAAPEWSVFRDNMAKGGSTWTSFLDDVSGKKPAQPAGRGTNPAELLLGGARGIRDGLSKGLGAVGTAARNANGVASSVASSVGDAVRRPAEVGGAVIVQQAWRRHVDASRPPDGVHAGYLFKTSSGTGPLERLREAREAAEADEQDAGVGESSALLIDIADMPPPKPRFARWFVLDERRATLAIYTDQADYNAGRQPKGYIDNLRSYAVLRLKGVDGITLAVLPHTGIANTGRPPSPIQASADARPAAAAGVAAHKTPSVRTPSVRTPSRAAATVEVAGEEKSWYLRAADDRATDEWCRMLHRAGAPARPISPTPPSAASLIAPLREPTREHTSKDQRSKDGWRTTGAQPLPIPRATGHAPPASSPPMTDTEC